MRRHRSRLLLLVMVCALCVVGASARAHAADNAAPAKFTAEQLDFFETEIRPLLAAHCWKCHGETKQQGELRLDSRAERCRNRGLAVRCVVCRC